MCTVILSSYLCFDMRRVWTDFRSKELQKQLQCCPHKSSSPSLPVIPRSRRWLVLLALMVRHFGSLKLSEHPSQLFFSFLVMRIWFFVTSPIYLSLLLLVEMGKREVRGPSHIFTSNYRFKTVTLTQVIGGAKCSNEQRHPFTRPLRDHLVAWLLCLVGRGDVGRQTICSATWNGDQIEYGLWTWREGLATLAPAKVVSRDTCGNG